ncbi:PAS domain-containing protein [Ferrovibrio terrae]|uniref:PAS domain-containing protein n=1 Tax=Ferrovibrio terrae TaxID=2594003 RepID=UPI003137D871
MPYSPQNLRSLLDRQNGIALPIARTEPVTAASLLSDDSRQFLAAWKQWRGDRLVPQRADMDLVSIARLMPKLVLLDVFSPDRAVFRLAGCDIESLVGMRLTGRDFVAMAAMDQRAMRSRMIWDVATRPCGVLSFHALPYPGVGRTHHIEVFALPIRPDAAEAPMQVLAVASRLPAQQQGGGTRLRLEQTGVTQHCIDIGAGIPA